MMAFSWSPFDAWSLPDLIGGVRQVVPSLEIPIEVVVVIAAVGALFVVEYLVVRTRVYRYRRPPPTLAYQTEREQSHDTGGKEWVVVCESCRTPNQLGYRYCHNCLAPLPERVYKVEATEEP